MNSACLHITSGQSRGTKIALNATLTVGSAADAGLRLTDPGVAEDQARFEVKSGVVWLTDLSPEGSTRVDGRSIGRKWQQLPVGSNVRFGLVEGRVEAVGEAEEDLDDPLQSLTLGLSDSELDVFDDDDERSKTWAIPVFPDGHQPTGPAPEPVDKKKAFQHRKTEVMLVPDEDVWEAQSDPTGVWPAPPPMTQEAWEGAPPADAWDVSLIAARPPAPRRAARDSGPALEAVPAPTPAPTPAPRPIPSVAPCTARHPAATRAAPSAPSAPAESGPGAAAWAGLEAHGYSLEKELSRSPTGILLAARQTRLGRPVLVRVLPPAIASDARAAAQLRADLGKLAALEDPHIVPIYDLFEAGGSVFLVTGRGSGESVRDLLDKRSPLPPEEALQLAREVLLGLHCAAEVGVLHRDLRPSRLYVDGCHRVRIADFGLASAAAAAESPSGRGWVLGTPAYLSPELCAQLTVDHRSDLYAIGVILFEMLTGQPPFIGPSAEETFNMHRLSPVPSVRRLRAGLSAELEMLVARLLAKRPSHRFQKALEVVAAIEQLAFKPAGVVRSQRAAPPVPAPAAARVEEESKPQRRYLVESDLLLLAAVVSLRLLSLERLVELCDASPDEEPNLLERVEQAQLLNATQYGKIKRLVEISTIVRRDGFYAKAAVENKLATRAQLNKAIAIQIQKMPDIRIGRILYSMKAITRRQDRALESVRQRVSAKVDSVLASKAEEILFGAGDKARRAKQLAAAMRPLQRWMEKTTVPRLSAKRTAVKTRRKT